MDINVHAGHNPDGAAACGAVGFIQESTEARKVKDEVIRQLRKLNHTVYDCTCEDGINQSDILRRIVRKCNSHVASLDISIHFNSGAKDAIGNGETTGVEVFVYDLSGKARPYAENVCKAISSLGFKNRGVKKKQNLYVLKNTSAPAMLIECCFVDDKDDVQLYDYRKMATEIVNAVDGFGLHEGIDENGIFDTIFPECKLPVESETPTGDKKSIYRVQVGAYSVKENAKSIQEKLKKSGFDSIIISA